ncbi:MAG: hypothetical protein R3F28_12915 [Candidatus Kapaibacterium sp.]|nr:hypothetical protein [Ignavibacteria bacterium]
MRIPGRESVRGSPRPEGVEWKKEGMSMLPAQPPLQGGSIKKRSLPWSAACGFLHGNVGLLPPGAVR